jgi:hypothetical protein
MNEKLLMIKPHRREFRGEVEERSIKMGNVLLQEMTAPNVHLLALP